MKAGTVLLAGHRERHANRGEELLAADVLRLCLGPDGVLLDGLVRLHRCLGDGRILVLRFRLGGLGLVLRLCLGLDGVLRCRWAGPPGGIICHSDLAVPIDVQVDALAPTTGIDRVRGLGPREFNLVIAFLHELAADLFQFVGVRGRRQA